MFGLSSIRDMTTSVRIVDNVTRPLVKINRSLDVAKVKFGELTKSLHKGAMAMTMAGAAFTAGGAAILLPLRGAVQEFGIFDTAMANLNTMLEVTPERLKEIRKGLLDLTRTIPKSVVELTGAAYFVQSYTNDQENLIKTTGLAAKAAVAGNTQVTTSAEAGIQVMNAWGLSIENLNNLYDKQFMTLKLAGSNYEQFASALTSGLIPAAKAAGVSIDEMNASFALVTKKGLSPEIAGTAISRFFELLADPKRSKDIRDMGVAITKTGRDGKEHMRPLADILKDLNVEMEKSKDAQALWTEWFPELRAKRAAITLVENADALGEYVKEMEDSSGAMEEAFQKQMKFEASLKLTMSSINRLKDSFGATLAPSILKVSKGIGIAADIFDAIPAPIKKVIAVTAALTGIALAVGGAILLFAGAAGMAVAGVVALVAIIGGLGVSLGGILGGIGAVTLAIMNIIGAVLLLKLYWKAAWGGMKKAFQVASDWITANIDNIIGAITSAYEKIKPFLGFIFPALGMYQLAGDIAGRVGMPSPRELVASTTSASSTSYSTKQIGKIEIKVDGSKDPGQVAKEVKKKIEREFTEM